MRVCVSFQIKMEKTKKRGNVMSPFSSKYCLTYLGIVLCPSIGHANFFIRTANIFMTTMKMTLFGSV